MDVLYQCFVCEVLAYWNHTLAASVLASDNLCVDNLVRNGSGMQRAILPKVL